MITGTRLLYAQNWKSLIILTLEELLVKIMNLTEMIKLTSFLIEKKNIVGWKTLIDLLQKWGEMHL